MTLKFRFKLLFLECGIAYPGNTLDSYDYTSFLGDGMGFSVFSYPATVEIVTSYETNLLVNGHSYLPYYGKSCLGTLINRRTILTSATCVPDAFPYTPPGKTQTFNIPIVLNQFYDTWNSIFSVYFAVNKFGWFYADITPTFNQEIDYVIRVSRKLGLE